MLLTQLQLSLYSDMKLLFHNSTLERLPVGCDVTLAYPASEQLKFTNGGANSITKTSYSLANCIATYIHLFSNLLSTYIAW